MSVDTKRYEHLVALETRGSALAQARTTFNRGIDAEFDSKRRELALKRELDFQAQVRKLLGLNLDK